jgi:hypothetical protein
MKTGLLWYDDGERPLPQKVALAVVAYRRKFGAMPDLCLVHKSALDDGAVHVGTVEVAASPTVLRCHFFVGVRDGATT